MADNEIKGIFSPRKDRFPIPSGSDAAFFKDSFSLRTILLLGATAQAGLTLILPPRYALLPTAFLILHTIASTVHSVVTFPSTPPSPSGSSPTDTIPGRASVFLPSPQPSSTSSIYSPTEKQGLAVLHLGVRFSHPLGLFAPGVREIGAHFKTCNDAVLDSAKPYGCIGYSSWRGTTDDTNNTMVNIYYFRHIQGLNDFAHGDVHRKAWEWYERECTRAGKKGKGKGYAYIGVFHEAFEVDKGGWETIAVNMPPTLLGAGSVPVKVDKGEKVWVSPLVEAKGRMFKGQWDRMGRGGGKGE
ncbi:hypothetical protein B0T14DRAFT_569231 [Immersiella caudata]|uniref:Uncharacterized protein n=1 Tax=Immersiella caudata TaxID=314043 RepID=A0AA40BY11_9PEZI|nr:hypothetical protein B0T14DRAFT_569231 [Immersiella caudata]